MKNIKIITTYCLITVVCIFINPKVYALTPIERQVVGAYDASDLKTDISPLSYFDLTLLKNNRYILIGSFETIIGDWQVTNDKYVYLTPDNSIYPYSVYGRYNNQLKNETKLYFYRMDYDDKALIRLGDISADNTTMRPLKLEVKENESCERTYSNATLPNEYNSITLAHNSEFSNKENKELLIYTYKNPSNYNEFIIRNNQIWRNRPSMQLEILEGSLKYKGNKAIKIIAAEELNNDPKLLEMISEKLPPVPDAIYQSIKYQPYVTPETSENYRFDDLLKGYILKSNSDDTEIFYQYSLLDDIKVQQSTFEVASEPLVYSRCVF